MRPGVVDIAALCGVSPSTVCRALNGKADINQATKRKILAACRRQGFIKDRGASSLRARTSSIVACLTPDMSNELFIEKLHFLKEEILKAGLTPRLYSYRGREEAAMFLGEIVSSRPAGLIAQATPDAAMKKLLRANGTPVVFYDADVPGMDSVALDRQGGSREAVRHLLGRGCRRIALLGAELASPRGRGYALAIEEAGLAVDARLVLDAPFGRDLFRYGYEQVRDAWPAARFDGLYAVNDASAIGAMRALGEAGAHVPGDVAVVGFDDIMVGPFVSPSLSTVRQPKDEMARCAVRFLLERMAGGGPRRFVRLPLSLRIRESSGKDDGPAAVGTASGSATKRGA